MRILHGIEQLLTIITETIFLKKTIISLSKSMKKCYLTIKRKVLKDSIYFNTKFKGVIRLKMFKN